MRLFEISDDKQIALNKEWIFLIPEFKALFTRDKGSEGDYRGQYKKQATRELTFVYFMCDFNSPIRDWKPEEKKKEALYYADLDAVDTLVYEAMAKYEQLMLGVSRSLRTLKSVYKGMDEMDRYFETVKFDHKDKQGKLLNTPQDFIKNTSLLNKMYDEVRSFEKRIEADMAEAGNSIRGNATLGDREAQKASWSESDIQEGSQHTQEGVKATGTSTWDAMLKTIQEEAVLEKEAERKEVLALTEQTEEEDPA